MSLLKKIEKNPEVLKHSAAIHVKGDLSLVDRKVMNVLLKNAYEDLKKKKIHSIKLSELQKVMGWNFSNDRDIKKILTKLAKTPIEWNILGKDKKWRWGTSSLLSSIEIIKNTGICEYTYSEHLIEKLSNPNIYAKLNLLTQKSFTSRYSLILWELLTEQISTFKRIDEEKIEFTKLYSLREIRDIFSIPEGSKPEFKKFNQKILSPAVKEINNISTINISVSYTKENRKVVGISFEVTKKKNKELKDFNEKTKYTIILQKEFLLSEEEANTIVMSKIENNGIKTLKASIEAAREYLNSKEDAIPAAVIKKSILSKWKPKNKSYDIEIEKEIEQEWHISYEASEQENYNKFLKIIKRRVGQATYDSWFKINLEEIGEEEITLRAKSDLFRQELINKYESVIEEAAEKIYNKKFFTILIK